MVRLLAGNKKDLDNQREVLEDQGKKVCSFSENRNCQRGRALVYQSNILHEGEAFHSELFVCCWNGDFQVFVINGFDLCACIEHSV